MARTLDNILAEVNARSDPQRKIILGQIADIPNQIKAEEAGLQAKQSQSFDEILGGARRRGLGFSGIPLEEQARYTATEFLPAVARLKQSGREQKATLDSALADIGSKNYATAYDIYNQERNFAEQQRQFNENLAWQREQARQASTSGGGGASPFVFNSQPQTKDTQQTEKKFIGSDDFRGRLAYLAKNGNNDARIALKYAGNDAKYDGPVKDMAEYIALQRAGIKGRYYMPGLQVSGGGESGFVSFGAMPGLRF